MSNILKYQNPSSPLLPAAIKIGYTYKPNISRSTKVEGATPITDLQELSKKEKRGLYEAYDFYANDVYPRKQKYNGSYNPEIHNMDNLTKRVIFREPLNFKNGFNRGGYAPIYLPSESSQIPNFLTPIVTRKPRDFGNTVLHEATHAEDGDSFKTDNFKLGESMTDEEVKLLDDAYKFEYEDDMTRAEKQTTNREFRFGLSRLTGLYLDDLTDYINNLSTKELKKLYKKINPGYKELMVKPKYDDNWGDAVKKALIQVGQNTTDRNRIDYKDPVTFAKKGGRIYIKKKNRGSFTRWCKGRVTEECIRKGKNSSNPAIRKKAVFAANARRWKHENGGILKAQNSVKLPGGYAQYDGSDLSDVETFNKNWLNYRNSQLANQGWKDESIKNKLNWFQRNFGASDKTVANLVREQLFSNLDNTKELSFSDALKDLQGRYLLTESMYADFPGERELHEVEIGPPKPVEDWKLDYSFNGSVGGTHYPDFNTIIYNGLYQNTPVKIHERDHAMFGQYDDKNIGLKIVDNIFKHEFLDDVVDKWGYYDEPSEIRARLMEMRYNNRLDPNHKYTFDEIENMRNDPTFIDNHIFDRYTNKYIEYLLNDVAQNTTNKNRLDYKSPINFAKDGGILKAQEGTGNLLTPHPLSPIGIAVNQAKAMAKMKGEQQHLPPGVKEVVGPDGEKVAIRSEQPLVPLEQSIAEWLPGTGDVAEVGYIADDVKNGNYGSAALAAGLMFLPGNVNKLISKSRIDPIFINGKINQAGIQEGLFGGKRSAESFMGSQTYKDAVAHDIALAKRAFGYDINPVVDDKYIKMPVKVEGASLGPHDAGLMYPNPNTNNPADDRILVDVGKHKTVNDLAATIFHENLHHGRFKTIDPQGNTIFTEIYHPEKVNPTLDFYRWKLKHLFKPEVEIPQELLEHYKYLTGVEIPHNEGATNVLELGFLGNARAKSGYPGTQEVQKILDEVRKANPQHAYTIDLLNMKKPKRVWEAMTGQYEDGGKLTDDDYRERVKKFLLWRTVGPEESIYIKNFKM